MGKVSFVCSCGRFEKRDGAPGVGVGISLNGGIYFVFAVVWWSLTIGVGTRV